MLNSVIVYYGFIHLVRMSPGFSGRAPLLMEFVNFKALHASSLLVFFFVVVFRHGAPYIVKLEFLGVPTPALGVVQALGAFVHFLAAAADQGKPVVFNHEVELMDGRIVFSEHHLLVVLLGKCLQRGHLEVLHEFKFAE